MILAELLVCGACAGHGDTPRPPPPAPSAHASATSATDIATAGPWREATDDGLAARRLAELYTAPELLMVARGDETRAAAALSALGHARDVELVLGSLAEMALEGRQRRAVLESLRVAVARGPRDGEPLDPPSLRRCIQALDRLSRDEGVDRGDRAIAVSALRALARAGYLDEKRITTALDP